MGKFVLGPEAPSPDQRIIVKNVDLHRSSFSYSVVSVFFGMLVVYRPIHLPSLLCSLFWSRSHNQEKNCTSHPPSIQVSLSSSSLSDLTTETGSGGLLIASTFNVDGNMPNYIGGISPHKLGRIQPYSFLSFLQPFPLLHSHSSFFFLLWFSAVVNADNFTVERKIGFMDVIMIDAAVLDPISKIYYMGNQKRKNRNREERKEK